MDSSTTASKNVFNWDDPFLLDAQLEDDERMIRDAAAAFAADKLAPRVTDAYLNETVDRDIFAEMGEAGLLGVTVSEEYGGAGAGYVSYGLVAREVERIDSGYRSMMSVQSSLVMYPIYAYGSDAHVCVASLSNIWLSVVCQYSLRMQSVPCSRKWRSERSMDGFPAMYFSHSATHRSARSSDVLSIDAGGMSHAPDPPLEPIDRNVPPCSADKLAAM